MYRSGSIALALLLLVFVGAGARLLQFWRNDSLMLDECAICLNIASRDPGGFTRTLDYNQAAPIGFLLLQRSAFATFGMDDITARILPLVFGLLTLALIVLLSRRIFDARVNACAVVLAVGLISLNRGIIAYSATAKQYSLECAVT